jgi:glycosyltransferase involved in cell wall biosynthesis
MPLSLSVIIPTSNPNIQRLNKTLNGLKEQTLSPLVWELILIDNNSGTDISTQTDFSWHPNSHFVYEPKQGLTYARLNGIKEAKGSIIVMVDDDNILDTDYLEKALHIFKHHPNLGAIGGKSIPLFEIDPPEWLSTFYSNLALRDLGNDIIIERWRNKYPDSAPIGAGMVLRKTVLQSYVTKVSSGKSIIADRTAASLSSGGDNDIVIEVLKSGWDVGYFPVLKLSHIIPAKRMQVNYLARLVNNTNKSWIQLLNSHAICPWSKIAKWTIPLRKTKAWFNYKAWQGKANYITWRGACGTFDGLANKL